MKYAPLMLLTIIGFLPTQGQAERPAVPSLDQRIALLLTPNDPAPVPVPVPVSDPFAVQAKAPTPMCPGCACGCAAGTKCTCATMTQIAAPKKMTAVKWVCSGNSCQQVAYESTDGGVTWAPAAPSQTVVYTDAASVATCGTQSSGSSRSSGGGFLSRIRERIANRRAGRGSCGN